MTEGSTFSAAERAAPCTCGDASRRPCDAYPPGKTEIARSLSTTDLRMARSRAVFELARIEAEFQEKKTQADLHRVSLATRRIRNLSDSELEAGCLWSHQLG